MISKESVLIGWKGYSGFCYNKAWDKRYQTHYADAVHATEHGHDQWRLGKTFNMKQHAALQNASGNAEKRLGDNAHAEDATVSTNVALFGSDHELIQLKTRLEDLETSLDKAQRRIERLLGERNQLSALLDKRDEQIQRVYRELGPRPSLAAAHASDQGALSSWRERLPAFVGRLLAIGRIAEPAPNAQGGAMEDVDEIEAHGTATFRRPPLVVNYKKAEPQAVLGVLLFGLDECEIGNLLPIIESDCSTSNTMPLLLTDNDAFELLRARDMIFEYLPPAKDRELLGCHLNWDLYLQRRLAIIRQKWQPARVIAFGTTGADMLRLWHSSPFEEIPLPAVVV